MNRFRFRSDHLLKNSVFFKVTILFVVALALVVSSLVVFNMLYFRRATPELYWKIRSQSYLSLELSVNNKLDEYATMMYRMVTDTEVREPLLHLDNPNKQAYTMAVQSLSDKLQDHANASSDIIAITVFSPGREQVLYDRSRVKIGATLWDEDRASGQLDVMVDRARREKRVFFQAEPRHLEGRSLIHVVLSVWDYYTKEDMGTVVMTVDAAALWKLIGSGAAEREAVDFLAQADGCFLVYPNYSLVGMPISGYTLDTAAARLLPAEGAEGDNPLFHPNADISVKQLSKYNIYLISVLEPGIYSDNISYYTRLAAFFAVAIALLFTVIYALVLRGLLRSVRQVVEGIERVRDGNLDVRIDIPPRDEIYYIAEAFNSTVESLATISSERDQEFLRFLRESECRRRAEIRSLQSQINSHFLYNTLNVINYTALEGNSAKTSKMIKSLANCLRYTLDKHWDEVRVADEVEWLEQYLLLQKERQPSLFNYRIDVAEDAVALPIQKLIIQPFVENAILHGFTGCKTTRSLDITIRRLSGPDRIAIAIYDNGVGIPPDQLAEIKELLRNYTRADSLGIGVENACFRLSMHYKAEARIFVRSRPGDGTKFNILLPISQEPVSPARPPLS